MKVSKSSIQFLDFLKCKCTKVFVYIYDKTHPKKVFPRGVIPNCTLLGNNYARNNLHFPVKVVVKKTELGCFFHCPF